MKNIEHSYLSLKLKQIVYSGDNIGRELKFLLKIEEQVTEINLGLHQGEKRSFGKVVFQKTSKDKAINVPITVKISETDERYIDVGSGISRIKLRLKKGTFKHVFNIIVKGIGRDRKKIATFTFLFELMVEPAVCYVSDVRPNGWLRVKFDDGDIYPLPQWLMVEIIKIEKKREFFRILEGKFSGRKASVGLKEDGRSYLLRKGEHRKLARLIFDQKANKLTIAGLGTYKAIVEVNPIPAGKYDLEIPDDPHLLGRYYLQYSKYAKTWFRIGHNGERYLHVGRRSEGCVTLTDKEKWTEIYNFLICSRKDFKSVGEIIIR